MSNALPHSVLGSLVEGLDHVGLAVGDLDSAIAFHTEVLGLELLHREENSDQRVVEVMLGRSGGDGRRRTEVQLLAPLTAESAVARFLQRNGPGLQHLAYRVHDLDDACAALQRHAVPLLYPLPRRGTRASRINFIHPRDAGGVLVEIVEPAG